MTGETRNKRQSSRKRISMWLSGLAGKDTFLFAKFIPDISQIIHTNVVRTGPFPQPFLVEDMVVEWEDGLDICPFALLRCNTNAAFRLWAGYQTVDNPKSLSI